jgi:murein L,D-transpeptidase YcbB/YkuD
MPQCITMATASSSIDDIDTGCPSLLHRLFFGNRSMMVRRQAFLLILAVLAVAPAVGSAAPVEPQAFQSPAVEQPRAALQQLLAQEPAPVIAGRAIDAPRLRRLYEPRGYAPIWTDRIDRVAALTAALAAATDDGLDLAPVVQTVLARPLAAAEREILLSDTALRLATSLATGRTQPEQWEEDWAIRAPLFDAATGLDKALGGDRLAAWIGGLAPIDPRYLRLKEALARYREIARQGGWPQIPSGPTIKIGESDPRIPTIRRRLIIEGDLPEDTTGDEVFDPVLAQGLFAFQSRHGILGDSAIGVRSIAAMNVTARQRVEQIALNLERWRSLPREFGKNSIFINVPAAMLEVFEDGAPVMKMRVVTGDPKHPTPVVQSRIQAVTFNPSWRIPSSIIKNEIAPKLKRDPHYLEKNEMIRGPGGLEQIPGPKNPLGRIKFETPNKFDVYLHDTPSRNSFGRVARAESHGCVRLEDARGLAAYILMPPRWTPELIEQAIAAGGTQRTDPSRRLSVSILYFTSFVDADGTVEFREDVYGRDKRLREALDGVTPRSLSVIAKARPEIPG